MASLGLLILWTKSLFRRFFLSSSSTRNTLAVEKSPYNIPLPRVKHRTLTEEEISDREIVIIGDIHGCYEELCLLLNKCNEVNPNTLFLFVGDLVNKGPGNLQVVRMLYEMRSNVIAVRGNHDEVCLLEWQNFQDSNSWFIPEEFKWMAYLHREEMEWLAQLPYTVSIPSRHIAIVHAGLVPGVPINDQSPNHMLHMRDLKYDTQSLQWVVCEKSADSEPWASKWPGPDHVYFGHDARRFYQSYQFATGLDTACVYGCQLTAVYPGDGGKRVVVEAIGVPQDKPQLEPFVM